MPSLVPTISMRESAKTCGWAEAAPQVAARRATPVPARMIGRRMFVPASMPWRRDDEFKAKMGKGSLAPFSAGRRPAPRHAHARRGPSRRRCACGSSRPRRRSDRVRRVGAVDAIGAPAEVHARLPSGLLGPGPIEAGRVGFFSRIEGVGYPGRIEALSSRPSSCRTTARSACRRRCRTAAPYPRRSTRKELARAGHHHDRAGFVVAKEHGLARLHAGVGAEPAPRMRTAARSLVIGRMRNLGISMGCRARRLRRRRSCPGRDYSCGTRLPRSQRRRAFSPEGGGDAGTPHRCRRLSERTRRER